jgi:RNA polymerase sigma factor (TIGR02999 family)
VDRVIAVALETDSSARGPTAHADGSSAFPEVFEATYQELRRLARRQLRSLRPGDTLATTALVNEAYLKLATRPVGCQDKSHFFALAARAMRQILVDYARERHARKRGGGRRRTTLDESALQVETIADDVIAIDRALSRLEAVDERLARLVEWRFFGGMTEEEIATAERITSRTVRRDWQKARAFLYREFQSARR